LEFALSAHVGQVKIKEEQVMIKKIKIRRHSRFIAMRLFAFTWAIF